MSGRQLDFFAGTMILCGAGYLALILWVAYEVWR